MRMIKGRYLLVTIIFLMLYDVAHSVDYDIDGKIYGGYAVVLNGETGEGFVYANQAKNSLLLVFYPKRNAVYVYSIDGQSTYFADDVRELILKFGVSVDNLISIIKPIK